MNASENAAQDAHEAMRKRLMEEAAPYLFGSLVDVVALAVRLDPVNAALDPVVVRARMAIQRALRGAP